jgi:hypothetical protein
MWGEKRREWKGGEGWGRGGAFLRSAFPFPKGVIGSSNSSSRSKSNGEGRGRNRGEGGIGEGEREGPST